MMDNFLIAVIYCWQGCILKDEKTVYQEQHWSCVTATPKLTEHFKLKIQYCKPKEQKSIY